MDHDNRFCGQGMAGGPDSFDVYQVLHGEPRTHFLVLQSRRAARRPNPAIRQRWHESGEVESDLEIVFWHSGYP